MSDSDTRASFRRQLEALKENSRASANTASQNLLHGNPASARFPQFLGISGLDRSQPLEQQCEGVVQLKECIHGGTCRGTPALADRHQFLDRCSAQSVCCGQRGSPHQVGRSGVSASVHTRGSSDAARKWRVPALSVHALLADEWARVRIRDGQLTGRADGVPVAVESVGQARVSQSEKCSKLNTFAGRTQDALRLGRAGAIGRSSDDRGYQS
jgi:hypothetical protein